MIYLPIHPRQFCLASCFWLMLLGTKSTAQNVTSPYSILGIGDMDTKDFGRYFATGNASLARRDEGSYNFSNPASLTAVPLKTVNFDLTSRGRISVFDLPNNNSQSDVTKDFIVKRISLSFKPKRLYAFAVGLRPFSSVNYQYANNQAVLDGNSNYTRTVEGSGGINQIYVSGARTLGKRLSVGVTLGYLFGSLTRNETYTGSILGLDVTQNRTDFYTGFHVQGGLQYQSKAGKSWQHQLGLVGVIGTDLNGESARDYLENSVSFNKTTTTLDPFQLPSSVGLGYTATYRNHIRFSAEANYYNWIYQSVDFTNSYTNPAARFSTGVEFSKTVRERGMEYEKYYWGFGASVENSYLYIRNNRLWDYSVSAGGGFHVYGGVSMYGGIELGKKGHVQNNQIAENYTQFVLGFTIREIWVGQKFLRKNIQ